MTAPATRMTDVEGMTLAGRLAEERQAVRVRAFSIVALVGAAVAALAIAVGAWALAGSRWLALPRGVPVAVWVIGAVGALALAYWLHERDREARTIKALAAAVEGEQGLRAGSLRGALEVSNQGVFGAHAAQAIAARLPRSQSLVPAVRSALGRRLAIAGALACGALALVALSARFARDGFAAVVHPVNAWRGLLLPPLGFPGVPTSVPRGMPLTVRVAASGRPTVTVSMRAAGEAWTDTTLDVDAATGLAKLALGPVRAPISLRASDGRAPVAEITLSVGDRGWVGDVSLQATYPAYLGRNGETLELVSPLRVPRGTSLLVTAGVHGGARNAALTNGKDTVHFTSAGDSVQMQTRLSADRDGTWHWIAEASPRGASSANSGSMLPEVPEDFALVIAPDQLPQVAILSPGSDSAIGTSGTLPLTFSASDDHGVDRVLVTVWREPAADVGSARATPAKREQLLVAEPGMPLWAGQGGLPLVNRGLEPGDRLHIVAAAIDNSPWRQEGQSAELVLKVPSLSDQRTMARSLGDSLAAQAQRLATAEKKLQQSTTDASRQRDMKAGGAPGGQSSGDNKSDGSKAKDGTMSFAAAERAKQVSRDQQQLTAKLDSMRSAAKELEQRLKDAGALDTALANRMRDVQKMLRDAMTPDMQQQLNNLDQATDRLSGTDAQKSMEQLAAQQQQMREQLEKSAEMLKRAAMEGTMQTLRDEANDLAQAQKQLAQKQKQSPSQKATDEDKATSNVDNGRKTTTNSSSANKSSSSQQGENMSAKELAERTKDLQKEVDALAKKLEQQGAKPGAQHARDAEPLLEQSADAMQRAAKEQQQNADGKQQSGDPTKTADQKQGQSGSSGKQDGQQQAGQQQGQQQSGQQQGQQRGGGQQPGGQQGGQQGQQGQQGGQQSGGQPGNDAQRAADAMDKAASQLAQARQSQVDAWKNELSQQLDQSINETMQLAKQQASLEQRAKQQGASSAGMQGEQGAIQQGVQQAAQRLEEAGRSSSLLSQRSQKAMADAQKRSQQATQSMGQAGTPGGSEAAQNAMKDATEALNQALSALVRDRERVNSAQSASGFTEMMEQLKDLAKQQGNLNGQTQGLNLLPGGAQGQQAQAQSRVLAKQQRDVARALQDVSDADASGRTDALAKEAQQLAQSMERIGPDPAVAARQQQLYRRLLDAGRFLEQDERDDQGPREAKAADNALTRAPADGAQSGKAANKFAAPTWNDLRGLGAEERRLVLEYFRRLNSKP